jgi:hypothetical protein
MPWSEHNPLEPSSSIPQNTSIGYELAHKHLAHLLQAKIMHHDIKEGWKKLFL